MIATLRRYLQRRAFRRDAVARLNSEVISLQEQKQDLEVRLKVAEGRIGALLAPEPVVVDPHLTDGEREALAFLREHPGLTTAEFGRAASMATDWSQNYLAMTGNEPAFGFDNHSRPLLSLVYKGHARRERSGRTFRYWPSDG